MLVTTHCASGALVGLFAPSVPAAALLGLLSHFALDAIPHWGASADSTLLRERVAVADGLAGLAVLGALGCAAARCRSSSSARALVGAAAATVPDWDKPYARFFAAELWPAPVNALHRSIQRESPDRLSRELVVAAISFISALTFAGFAFARAAR